MLEENPLYMVVSAEAGMTRVRGPLSRPEVMDLLPEYPSTMRAFMDAARPGHWTILPSGHFVVRGRNHGERD